MRRRITIEFLKQFAKEKGGECLSSKYVNPTAPVKWKCSNGHTWETPWKGMYDGRWCKKCHIDSIKLGIGIAQRIAKERGGFCLSVKYINWKSKLEWECNKGHKWNTCLDSVKNGKHWCPECALDKTRLTIGDCHKVAKRFSGKCLSKEYKNAQQKIKWKCKNGHIWSAKAASALYENKWCPRCRDKSQNVLAENIKKVYPNCTVEQKYRGFEWLNTKNGGRQEIDIWLPEIRLAIEYDGQGHFYPVNFGDCDDGTAKQIFEKTKILDKMKNKKIAKHKSDVEYFIRFSYEEDIFDIEYVRNKLLAITEDDKHV